MDSNKCFNFDFALVSGVGPRPNPDYSSGTLPPEQGSFSSQLCQTPAKTLIGPSLVAAGREGGCSEAFWKMPHKGENS